MNVQEKKKQYSKPGYASRTTKSGNKNFFLVQLPFKEPRDGVFGGYVFLPSGGELGQWPIQGVCVRKHPLRRKSVTDHVGGGGGGGGSYQRIQSEKNI